MKILVISDTHIPTRSDINLSDFFSDKEFDICIHCGDFDRYSTYNEILNLVGKDKLYSVYGNCDDFDTVSSLSEYEQFKLDYLNVGLIHSHQFADRTDMVKRVDFALSNGLNILFYGHSHIKKITQYKDGIYKDIEKLEKIDNNSIYLVNPGAMKYGDYLLLDI